MNPTNPLIEIEHFSFSYPGQQDRVLSDVSLAFEEGSFSVLIGRSGCGKSTLLRQLKTELAPFGDTEGQIRYRGKALKEHSHRVQSSEIGYVLQNPDNQIVTDKVWHELAFGLESLGCEQEVIRLRVAEMASYFGIQNWFYRNVSELSGGQKQLLNLAAIMAMHPRVLILDEPTSQLDPIAASDFLETVKKINEDIGTTVILTEHRLSDVIPHADHVIVMDQGQILMDGTPEKIGQSMHRLDPALFYSMPVPMQIYADAPKELQLAKHSPFTVSQGRIWLNQIDRLHTVTWNADPDSEPEKRELPDLADSFQGDKTGKKKLEAISMQEVWFRYAIDGEDVIRDLSLKIYAGEFYAIVGGNGTGKSTMLSLLSGIRRPYRGRIRLFGRDIRKYSDKELYRNCIGVLPQNPQSVFLKKTVLEDLFSAVGGRKEKKDGEYQADLPKNQAVYGMARLCHLEQLLERHPYDLSGGEQQRLALAKVLLLRPRILLLDEPTKGMDAGYKNELAEILTELKQQGLAILMISHDVEFVARYADRTGLFFQGNLVAQAPTRQFFMGNSFYTTAANRMARHLMPAAITGEDVVKCLTKSQ